MTEPLSLGEHYIIEIWECDEHLLNDENFIQETLRKAVQLANATIIDEKFHKFAPQGVSGVIVIAESHFSIHTWPEHGYAALDLFTCNLSTDIQSCIEYLKTSFHPCKMEYQKLLRGPHKFLKPSK